MRTREAAVREAWKTDDDRGAVLFILVLFLVIFIAISALALDLAATGDRAQDLQNTSDAAALAGVVEYQEFLRDNPGDPDGAEAAALLLVNQILEQNGIVDDPDVADEDRIVVGLTVLDNGTKVQVSITDPQPSQFLPDDFLGEVINGGGGVTRTATAEFVACDALCTLSVKIGKSFGAVSARGEGDGYKPILVNQKLYAINHNSTNRNIVCISTVTQAPCWGEDEVARVAYDDFSARNPEMPHTAVVGSQIFWAATDAGTNGHRLYCWETAAGTDMPCGPVTLNSSLLRFDHAQDDNILAGPKDENRGGGTFTVLGDKVFSFTDDHRIHCFDPAANATCSGYSGGRPTTLGAAGFPASSPVDGNHGSSIDRVVDEQTGRVYSTIHIPYAQNVDCSSPLAIFAGEEVVVINKEGRYLASDVADNVYATDDGATEAARWNIENFEGDISLQSVAHGQYLDAAAFATTSVDRGDDERWAVPITDENDAYWLNSHVAGTLVDVDGVLVEGDEDLVGVIDGAEWNFYDWECGIDPTRVDPGPDYFVSGTWLHCYNTGAGVIPSTPGPCTDFDVHGLPGAVSGAPAPIHADATRFSGRLWFFYDPVVAEGVEPSKRGVCSSGYSTWNDPDDDNNIDPNSLEVNCVAFGSGLYSGSMSSDMNGFRDLIRGYTGSAPAAWGDPHWNAEQNRLFYPTEHANPGRPINPTSPPGIVCFDFDDGATCGDFSGTLPDNPDDIVYTEDYGFISDGNCVYALGHVSYFWAFKADDIQEPCDATIPPTRVTRCDCGDGVTFRWGELDFSIVDLDLFEVFGFRIGTDDGGDGSDSVPIFPVDGSFNYLKSPDLDPGDEVKSTIPLDSFLVDLDQTENTILIFFDVVGLDEDLIADAEAFELRFTQIPRLVD